MTWGGAYQHMAEGEVQRQFFGSFMVLTMAEFWLDRTYLEDLVCPEP